MDRGPVAVGDLEEMGWTVGESRLHWQHRPQQQEPRGRCGEEQPAWLLSEEGLEAI